jgi:hypothetical protein
MLTIKNFDLYSFAVGSKHVRAFSIDNKTGVIADYVLGVCGVPESSFDKGFYEKVAFGPDGIEMTSQDDTKKFLATRDRLMLSERTSKIGQSLPSIEQIIARAKYVMPNVLSFMNKPKAIFLGMVWHYTESKTRPREKWNHPAARDLMEKTIKFPLDSKEFPSEINMRLTYRRKLGESFVTRGKDDYINIIFNVYDATISEIWPSKDNPISDEENPPRLMCLSIDVQRMLNPNILLNSQLFDEQWKYCNETIKPSIKLMLEKIGFEEQ